MGKYNFYYDESEHSRKINYKTVTAHNYYDNFVSVIIGWRSENQITLYKRYAAFEEKYMWRQSKGELKSLTIKQNQLEKGFASLNSDNLDLLEDFFALFDDKIHVYYAVISKIEYVVQQLFVDYKNSIFVDMDAMKYSITKAIVTYQPQEIIAGVYKNLDEFICLLKKFFLERIKENRANEELKYEETNQFQQIILFLDDVTPLKTIDWDYELSFVGFKKYLNEKSIYDYSLTVDREGETSNTVNAAKRVGLCAVSEADSQDSCGIRMADMLAGIISKLLKAIHNALRYTSPEEQIKKKILDAGWFAVNERQLALYKKLYAVTVDLNKAQYKVFSGIYADDLISFLSLLRFMNHFDSVEELIKDLEMQGEYFNAYACRHLSSYYERMRHKLPFDSIDRTSSEYFYNQRGAKVYFDIQKQPLIPIESGKQIYDVLSVGFNKEMAPLITVKEENGVMCYRLPPELSEWAITLVGLADTGISIFPSKVVFSKLNGKYFVDIL